MRIPGTYALAALALFATPAAAQSPALWSVSDADTTIYLFGGVHGFESAPTWLSGDVEAAYKSSDEVVLEVVVTDPAKARKLIERYGTSKRHLRASLPDAYADRLEFVLNTAGLKKSALDHFQPWYANIAISTLALSNSALRRDLGVDAVLQERARRDGKRLSALETADEQLAIFGAIPADAQMKQLGASLADLGALKVNTEETTRCWRVGDLACVEAVLNREYSIPEVRDAMLIKRNQRWAAWVGERLKRPGTAFVAVGVGHLVGAGSLLDQMKARGLVVKRVG